MFALGPLLFFLDVRLVLQRSIIDSIAAPRDGTRRIQIGR